jgi:hypothetical protein
MLPRRAAPSPEPAAPSTPVASFRAPPRARLLPTQALADHLEEDVGVEAPLSVIRRTISSTELGPVCGHGVAAPQFETKEPTPALRCFYCRCFYCAAGHPGDRTLVRKAIREADPGELEAELAERKVVLGIQPACVCTDANAGTCAMDHFSSRGVDRKEVPLLAVRAPCPCFCHAGKGGAA